MPGVQHQHAIHPDARTIVHPHSKPVRTCFKEQDARPSRGEAVRGDRAIRRAIPPVVVHFEVVARQDGETAEGQVVEVVTAPFRERPGERRQCRRNGRRARWNTCRRRLRRRRGRRGRGNRRNRPRRSNARRCGCRCDGCRRSGPLDHQRHACNLQRLTTMCSHHPRAVRHSPWHDTDKTEPPLAIDWNHPQAHGRTGVRSRGAQLQRDVEPGFPVRAHDRQRLTAADFFRDNGNERGRQHCGNSARRRCCRHCRRCGCLP